MDPILVDVAQLRGLTLPGITLTPGRVIMARVIEAEDGGGRGALSIAGGRLAAMLPGTVHVGDELRLVVKDVSAERIVLSLQAEVAPQAASLPPRETDPDGTSEAARRSAASTHVLELRYAAQHLGELELRFELYPGGALSVTVGVGGDAALAQASAAAGDLRAALERASGSSDVAVHVTTPRAPLDVYV
jgi:hypothetical protein